MKRTDGALGAKHLLAGMVCAVLTWGLVGCSGGAQASGAASAADVSSSSSAASASGLTSANSASASGAASAASSSAGSGDAVEIDDGGTTDQMFSEDVYGAELYVFQYGDDVFTADNRDSVSIWGYDLHDGGFYKVVADVTYLNGGIAGYVDYPEIKSIYSCDEVSPLDLDLPSIAGGEYGLLLIGDYADGDVLLRSRSGGAVWKGGSWVYRYDKELKLDDGTVALVGKDVGAQDVQAGAAAGVLSCADYFIMPKSTQ